MRIKFQWSAQVMNPMQSVKDKGTQVLSLDMKRTESRRRPAALCSRCYVMHFKWNVASPRFNCDSRDRKQTRPATTPEPCSVHYIAEDQEHILAPGTIRQPADAMRS